MSSPSKERPRVPVTPNEIILVRLPCSEVMMSSRLADRCRPVQLANDGRTAVVFDVDGQNPGPPVLAGEAGILSDCAGFYLTTGSVPPWTPEQQQSFPEMTTAQRTALYDLTTRWSIIGPPCKEICGPAILVQCYYRQGGSSICIGIEPDGNAHS